MQYTDIVPAKFIKRPNRFIAEIELDGKKTLCHVKNTGRCGELLVPGADIYVQRADNKSRKTEYDLICVNKNGRMVNIDSQIPNAVFLEWVKAGGFLPDISTIKPECRYKNSRFDFYLETADEKIFVEVKGVTLEEDGGVYFPDAPTERGVKHIQELCDCLDAGYGAYLVFVIQMEGVRFFAPNRNTHPAFADVLSEAARKGVRILALDCIVTPDTIRMNTPVPVCLSAEEILAKQI